MVEKFREMLGREQPEPETTEFIYVFLPIDIDPDDRHSIYGDALDAELRLAGIGYVSGGGSLLSEEEADGSRSVEFCGLDIDTSDTDAARSILREQLPLLGCPECTEVHYCRGDAKLQDEYVGGEWHLDRPRVMPHPGFGL